MTERVVNSGKLWPRIYTERSNLALLPYNIQETIAARKIEDAQRLVLHHQRWNEAIANTLTPEALAGERAMELKQAEEHRQMETAQRRYEDEMYRPVRFHLKGLIRALFRRG